MTVWNRTEVLSLLLATTVLVVTTGSAVKDWRRAQDDRIADQVSRVALESVNTLVGSVKDAETGQRGFLLTRNPKYLEPYTLASASIPAELSRLSKVLPHNADAERLAEVVRNKMEELKVTVDLRSRSSLEAALAVVITDRGNEEMEAIRMLSQRITAVEYAKLAESSLLGQERASSARIIDVSGSIVLLGLLILAAITIHRSAERREHLIALLREDDLKLRELGKKAQDAEVRMSDILQSIADGFVAFDRDFSITFVNSAAERILGRPKADLLGKSFLEELPDNATPDVIARYRQVIESQTPLSFELFSSQRNTWWEENIYPSKDGGLSVYFRDVSERRRMEERSRHTQKLESLGVLAGGIAHDFNNLLTAILGGASLLQESLAPESEAAGHLKIVMSASERAAQLTRQMLAYSGRGRFIVQQLDICQQIREITELLQSSVTRDVELVLNLNTEGVLIEADSGQIQQLVMNLVLNGAEAIEGSGTVVVSTRIQELDSDYVRDNMAGDNLIPGVYVLLEVHDSGKGMDEATQKRIFEPFFTTKFTGRGLGLAAVLGIVRGHRGAIKIYSHVGQGTTFKVFLPIAPEQTVAKPAKEETTSLRGTETVLVVDDDDFVQRMASATLTTYGYQILQAFNGREAVEIFERNPDSISLVLLDMTMPVMSGEETLRRLQEIRPDVLVITSSGYNEVEALRRFGQGVRDFLQKPYRAAQLAEKVKNALSVRVPL